MKRSTIVPGLAAVVGAALILVSGSAASPSRAGALPLLRVGVLNTNSGTLDLARNDGTGFESALGLETLMRLGPSGKLEPYLAQQMTHPGRDLYVFHLRHGVHFWDGSELTSADVANALNYERYPQFATSSAYTSVKTIAATDRYTVAVTLRHPDSSWPYWMATYLAEIFEKSFQQAHKQTMGQPGTLIEGTGPWKFDSFDPTSGIELSANPHWWGGKVPIQHISVKFFADQNGEALAMRAGAIDVVPLIQDIRAFGSAAGSSVRIGGAPSCTEGMFSMNTHMAPWSDVHVRRAVAYAINRADVLRAYGPGATSISTLIPPLALHTIASPSQVKALLNSLNLYPFSIAKAKAELAKSAYPNGFTANIDTGNYLVYGTITQVIVPELQKIGINAKANFLPLNQFFAHFGADPATLTPLFYTSGCLSPDPSWYPQNFVGSWDAHAGAYNEADYKNPAADALVKAAVATGVAQKRFDAYSKLLEILSNDVPYVPLFVSDSDYAIANNLTFANYSSTVVSAYPWALNVKAK
jgi:peptide/nickel transport system substrate-binding protein